jgi:hypothetical protein
MQTPGQQFFAGASFAADEYGALHLGCAFDVLRDAHHRGIGTENQIQSCSR